jgi:hypothetical protein
MRSGRLLRSAIVLKASTLMVFHRALVNRKYRLLFAPRRRKPGPKGPSPELIAAIVEMSGGTRALATGASLNRSPTYSVSRSTTTLCDVCLPNTVGRPVVVRKNSISASEVASFRNYGMIAAC